MERKPRIKPTISWGPRHKLMFITSGCHTIQVYLDEPCFLSEEGILFDITANYTKQMEGDTIIKNSAKHNHTVGSYNRLTGNIIIWLKEGRFLVKLPPKARKIYCGDNCYSVSPKEASSGHKAPLNPSRKAVRKPSGASFRHDYRQEVTNERS